MSQEVGFIIFRSYYGFPSKTSLQLRFKCDQQHRTSYGQHQLQGIAVKWNQILLQILLRFLRKYSYFIEKSLIAYNYRHCVTILDTAMLNFLHYFFTIQMNITKPDKNSRNSRPHIFGIQKT